MMLACNPFQQLRPSARAACWLLAIILLASLSSARRLPAQETTSTERVYKHDQAEVEKALEELQAYDTARLPLLAGFVNAKANTLKDYGNPHYQFLIELIPQGGDHTLVQVKAQITAWYVGSATTPHPQYVQIPSNGRLEEELLDRLSVYLGKDNSQAPTDPGPLPKAVPIPTTPVPTASVSRASVSPVNFFTPSPVKEPAAPATDAVVVPSAPKSSDPATLASQIATAQSELKEVEQKEHLTQQQISELDDIAKTRQHIGDFAIAKRTPSPVYAEPSVLSKVVFRADAEDEFEVTEARNSWAHIRLDAVSQGWIPFSELEMPGDSAVSDDLGVKNFLAANEMIQTFTGDWPVLKGKPALFVLAQPRNAISQDTLGKSQLEFASHTFLEGYRAAVHSEQPVSGVVVIFAGDKPGVAAATLPAIKQWQEGAVTDQAFFSHCSFDPPGSFRDTAATR